VTVYGDTQRSCHQCPQQTTRGRQSVADRSEQLPRVTSLPRIRRPRQKEPKARSESPLREKQKKKLKKAEKIRQGHLPNWVIVSPPGLQEQTKLGSGQSALDYSLDTTSDTTQDRQRDNRDHSSLRLTDRTDVRAVSPRSRELIRVVNRSQMVRSGSSLLESLKASAEKCQTVPISCCR